MAVQHQEACSPRVMSALLVVADRASLWRAFGEFILTATSADHIRQAIEAITGVSEAQGSRPAWAAQLLASVPGSKARPSEAKRSRDRRDSSPEDSPPRSKSRRESRGSRAQAYSPPNIRSDCQPQGERRRGQQNQNQRVPAESCGRGVQQGHASRSSSAPAALQWGQQRGGYRD